MRRHKCPVCGAHVSYWRMRWSRERSGTLQHPIQTDFDCSSCGTTLCWSIGNWIWLTNAILAGGCIAIAFFIVARENVAMRIICLCLMLALINTTIYETVRRPIVDDEFEIRRSPSAG